MAISNTTIRQKLDKETAAIIKRCNFDKRLIGRRNITYHELLSNKMLLIMLIREGVPYSLFDLIQHVTPFTEEDWAHYLDLSTKSLQRYKQSSRHFKPIQSEKIIEVAEVTNVGLDVFGSMEKFRLWLDTPNFALGNMKPMELLKDSYGKEMVIGELTRINHGIFA